MSQPAFSTPDRGGRRPPAGASASLPTLERLWARPVVARELRGGDLPPALERAYDGPLSIGLRADRPTFIANFVTTLDGVVSYATAEGAGGGEVSGFSVADRMLMGLLRCVADVVLVGAGTVRAAPHEEWTPRDVAPALADDFAAWRRTLGLTAQPSTAVVTATGRIDRFQRGLSRADVPVLILTTPEGRAALSPARGERVDVVAADTGTITSAAIVRETAARGARVVLCEGGPHLLGRLLADGIVDELFLTVAPQAAGRDRARPRLALVEGVAFALDDAPWARLMSIHRSGSHLFLRYAIDRTSQGGQ